ncbi:hypothetical protein F5J12DRAFT_819692 [Pisolithus orientalis]|uniref:uncharacterized protein n=1 Tax=Pisolithus orientalis TaxID=936130 RepID=UPI00222584BA|nr:uncharacterized protein F5J12DRAFT_819692 [Pisolithus orientalis]KAI6012682.1 hypothetical protein F5J12DRAFT_819692 [Pisolithus orientalis]
MPLLGGFFKRDKHGSNSRNNPSSTTPAATESVASVASTGGGESIEAEYVFPDECLPRPTPVYSGPRGASSSKLKLPFRRNKHVHQPGTPDASQLAPVSLNDAPPRSSVVSDPGHGLPPPPPKSSIFGVYNGRSPHSTRSNLCTDTPSTSSLTDVLSDAHSSAPSNLSKKPGLFSWARQRTKSKVSQPPSTVSSPPATKSGTEDSSFNLKSFRHIPAGTNASPQKAHNTSVVADISLPPPRPRPRDESFGSDSSQRISVAAFREAQARRSRAESPVPSFRPPSATDTLRLDAVARKRASTVSAVSGSEISQSNRASVPPWSSSRPNSSAVQTSSDSEDSSSEEDEDVDSGDELTQKRGGERTITSRRLAQSEMGHGSLPEPSPSASDFARWSRADSPRASPMESSFATRARASASTSAIIPDAAARRASLLAGTNSAHGLPEPKSVPQRRKNDDSDTSSDNSDSSNSEDKPLSTLVPPRRPGSSTSVSTNKSSRAPPKPLIDIKSLVGSPPVLTPVLRHENSIKKPTGKDEPFSPPPAINMSNSFMSNSSSPSPMRGQSPVVGSKQQPTTHHRRMSSEATTVSTATVKGPSDSEEELVNAIRLVNSFDSERDKEKSQTNSSAFPRVQEPEQKSNDRIIPTPIRERQPLSSFAVVSRPPQRASMSGISQTSPSSPSPPIAASLPVTSSPPIRTTRSAAGVGARPRSTTLMNPPSYSSTDKSDSKSTTSSSSRASRVPPIPLIRSIPDSPSVKADNRQSSQSTMKLRATSAGPPETRSRPQSHTLASLMSSPPSLSSSGRNSSFLSYGSQLMPQRPFVGNSSARGDSPAPSSTGESSSGGPPFTPRDGSEIGVRLPESGSDVGSTLKARAHIRKSSVTFEDIPEKGRERGRERAKSEAAEEERRRERRRSEAKAAIEFGKLVNSRGPLVHDGWDDELSHRSGNGRMRMSMNPMMGMGMEGNMPGMMTPSGWVSWQQPMATGMSGVVPQLQFNNDPAFLAAHQRAMMMAKQAYQMAVAQHAIAVAGEEWERSSNAGFGSGGSVYGGGSAASVYGGAGPRPGAGMMGMPNTGMLVPPGPWHGAPTMFPGTALMYGGGINSTQSEFGGAAGWASKSAYGESFGPSSRSSYLQAGRGVPASSASAYDGPAPRPRAKTGAAPPSSPRSPGRSRVPPPSSWKVAK